MQVLSKFPFALFIHASSLVFLKISFNILYSFHFFFGHHHISSLLSVDVDRIQVLILTLWFSFLHDSSSLTWRIFLFALVRSLFYSLLIILIPPFLFNLTPWSSPFSAYPYTFIFSDLLLCSSLLSLRHPPELIYFLFSSSLSDVLCLPPFILSSSQLSFYFLSFSSLFRVWLIHAYIVHICCASPRGNSMACPSPVIICILGLLRGLGGIRETARVH